MIKAFHGSRDQDTPGQTIGSLGGFPSDGSGGSSFAALEQVVDRKRVCPVIVTHCGRIYMGKKKFNFSTVFAGQAIGIKEVQDDIWLVSFMDYDLGY